ncbi:MAG: hypothetical protein RDV41_00990 [Planctomycetota bacterium]|nr:hypothetical protein [Planctomycetota bacterium]
MKNQPGSTIHSLLRVLAVALGILVVVLPPWVFVFDTLLGDASGCKIMAQVARRSGFMFYAPRGDSGRADSAPASTGSPPTSRTGALARAALNSVALALVTCAGCVLLGVPAAFALARTRLNAARWLFVLCLLPFLIPAHVHAIAWIGAFAGNGLLGRLVLWLGLGWPTAKHVYSFWGCAFIMTLCFWPCVALPCAARLAGLPRNLEDAARLHRGPAAALLSVALPQTVPALLAGLAVVFVLVLGDLAVGSILWPKTGAFEIFTQFAAFCDNKAALAATGLLLLAIAPALAAGLWAVSRLRGMAFDPEHQQPAYLRGSGGCACAVVLVAALVASVVVPLGALVFDTWAGDSLVQVIARLKQVLKGDRDSIVPTFFLAAIGAAAVVVVGLLTALALRSSVAGAQNRAWRMIKPVVWLGFLVPLAVPGMIVGLGLSGMYNHPGLRQRIFSSSAIVVLAYVCRFGFVGLAWCHYQLAVQGRRFGEAAAAHGVAAWRRVLRIEIPLAARSLLVLWFIVFVLCLGDLDTTMLVDPPGLMTLPKRIANLIHYSYDSHLAALCLILVVGCLVLFVPTAVLLARRRRRRLSA